MPAVRQTFHLSHRPKLWSHFCWCEEQHLAPVCLSEFSRLFHLLGVAKARIRGRVRYLGVNFVASRYPEYPTASKDTVQIFCNECLRFDPQASLTPQMLIEEYVGWAAQRREGTVSLPTFVEELEKLGIRKKRVARRMRFVGIALAE